VHYMTKEINLTGVWNCDDGGTYYIQQSENNIWWYGEKGSDNPFLENESWSNVARGEISGDLLVVSWSNVPKGGFSGYYENNSNGILILNISSDELKTQMKTGGITGLVWKKSPTLIKFGGGFGHK